MIDKNKLYLIQSTLYFQEILKIKKTFEKENIDFVFLKGLPLHLYFEKTHPKRIYGDCDILVAKTSYIKTGQILNSCGFKKSNTSYSFLHHKLKNKLTEAEYKKTIRGIPIVFDIHYEVVFLMNQLGKLDSLYPQKFIDKLTEVFLETKKAVTYQNEKYSILNTQYLILYLALHFFHHNYKGIYRLELLEEIITNQSKKINWRKLEKDIKYYNLLNFIYPAFIILQKYFKSSIPTKFLDSIKPQQDKLDYIGKKIMAADILGEEDKLQAGINRFKNLFFLSPNPLWKRVLILFTPQVVYSIGWVVYKKLFR